MEKYCAKAKQSNLPEFSAWIFIPSSMAELHYQNTPYSHCHTTCACDDTQEIMKLFDLVGYIYVTK